MADPYSTLGVSRDATEKDIKSAYRKLAKELHPDKNKDNPKATERFSTATQAYDLLSDKQKRSAFDRGEIDGDGNPANPFAGMGGAGGYRSSGQRPGYGPQPGMQGGFGGQEDGDLSDLFEGLFGGGGMGGARAQPGGFGGRRPSPPPQKGADVAYRLSVAFTDAAAGKDQRITLSDGKTIDLKLPAGVVDGQQMRLKGKGQPGPGGNGDGIVTISIGSHPFFRRDGDNIRMDLPITLDEALNGAKIKVPTVDGPVMMTLKPATDGGTVLRLGGKGFVKKDAQRGNQLVTLEIALPSAETDLTELAKRLENWQDSGNPRTTMGV